MGTPHKSVLIPTCLMTLGKSSILGIDFFLLSKDSNRRSYQAHLSGLKGIAEAEALKRCLALRDHEPGPKEKDLTGDEWRQCHHPTDSKTRTTDL